MKKYGLAFCWLLSATPMMAQSNDPVVLADEYYRQGDLEKAEEQYRELAGNPGYIPRIHGNYFKILLSLQKFGKAEKYVRKVIRQYPQNYGYSVDLALLFQAQHKQKAAKKHFDSIIQKVANKAAAEQNTTVVRLLAQTFFEKNLREKVLEIYQRAREVMGRPGLFSLDLAQVYLFMNKKQLMIKEYLTFLKFQPQNLDHVKNSFQQVLNEAPDLDSLKVILYDFIQKEAGNPVFNEMLVWTHLQQRNFGAALRQARALDKRRDNQGENTVNVGLIAFRNEDYPSANKAFASVINDFPDSPNRRLAQNYVLLSEEEVVKSTYPIDTAAVRALIKKYEIFRRASRDFLTALDAQRHQALLHAFYLNEIEKSIGMLTDLVNQPIGKHPIVAEAKMDLADIYLLDKQPWESILLYAQVERQFKEEPLGYQAKLKSARLSYFKGEFELAQGHLDILKLATSREIANDALDLSILIKNNTVFDSTDLAMQEYAHAELMLFQNQKRKALLSLDSMLVKYAQHSIADEIHYLKAKTHRELGEPAKAVESLNLIIENFDYDILADDALFLSAVILEQDLKDKENSMKRYTRLLSQFPGSIYVSAARKRFRELRGDF